MQSDLLSGASAAAEFTGLPRRKIYRMVEEGDLPCVRKGTRLYFRRSELEKAFRATQPKRQDARVSIEVGPGGWRDLAMQG